MMTGKIFQIKRTVQASRPHEFLSWHLWGSHVWKSLGKAEMAWSRWAAEAGCRWKPQWPRRTVRFAGSPLFNVLQATKSTASLRWLCWLSCGTEIWPGAGEGVGTMNLWDTRGHSYRTLGLPLGNTWLFLPLTQPEFPRVSQLRHDAFWSWPCP